ncbi:MAG: hypothetical protein ACLSHG_12815 [Oscillospiraceae bacterium]
MHLTRQFETAVCGGSNLKAPMKLDFLRSLCAQERHAWPEVVLCRVEGETLPVCCLSEAAAGDPFARIGIVTAPSEALTALSAHRARAGAGHGPCAIPRASCATAAHRTSGAFSPNTAAATRSAARCARPSTARPRAAARPRKR